MPEPLKEPNSENASEKQEASIESASFHHANPLKPPPDQVSWRSGWELKKTLSPEAVLPTITAIVGGIGLYFAISRYEVARIIADTAHLRASIEKIQPEILKIREETAFIREQRDQLPEQLRKTVAEAENAKANTDWIKGQLANLQATSAELIARTRVQSAGELNDILLSVRPIIEMPWQTPTSRGPYEVDINPSLKNLGKNVVYIGEPEVEISIVGNQKKLLMPEIDYDLTTPAAPGPLMPSQTINLLFSVKFKKSMKGKNITISVKYVFETDDKAINIITDAVVNPIIRQSIKQLGTQPTIRTYDYVF